MYNVNLENRLITPEIADLMQDYVSLQLDIDNAKIKAAALVAQEIDLTRIISKANVDRIVALDVYDDNAAPADLTLYNLIIAPLCYYTYSRCLTMFQGTFTDSGYAIETEAESRSGAKEVAGEKRKIQIRMRMVQNFNQGLESLVELRTERLINKTR